MRLNLPTLKDAKDVVDWASKVVSQIREHVDGAGLGFGNFFDSSTDNIAGRWYHYVTNPIANTEDTLQHNLGVIPTGFLTILPGSAGILYNGGTPWTTSQMFLKCSVANMDVWIFILAPSNVGR